MSIPDAPYIRDAELNGIDGYDPICCPCCGEDCEYIFKDSNGYVFGCENCIQQQESYEWKEEEGGQDD